MEEDTKKCGRELHNVQITNTTKKYDQNNLMCLCFTGE